MIRPNGSEPGEYNPNHIHQSCWFRGNCYDSSGDKLVISTDDGKGNYAEISSLEQWQAVGQENDGSISIGYTGDAGLMALEDFAPPEEGFLFTSKLSDIENFNLKDDSVCRDGGLECWPAEVVEKFADIDFAGKPANSKSIGAVAP